MFIYVSFFNKRFNQTDQKYLKIGLALQNLKALNNVLYYIYDKPWTCIRKRMTFSHKNEEQNTNNNSEQIIKHDVDSSDFRSR